MNSDDSYLQLSCKAPAELFQNMWRACYQAESVVQKWQGASKSKMPTPGNPLRARHSQTRHP
jgi:hypothetical protein